MENIKKCNLCNNKKFLLYAIKKGELTGKNFKIVKCKKCDLVFVNPRLDEKENLKLYDENYFNGKGFDSVARYAKQDSDKDKLLECNAIISKIKLFNKSTDIKILDIGCGTGDLIRECEKNGYRDVKGIEFSSYAANLARKKCAADIITGDFLSHNFNKEKFNVITANEVIEHIRDPHKFFAKVRYLLSKGGLFIYYTGNINSMDARISGKRWHYLQPEGHIFYYSPETIEKYFDSVGLISVKVSDLNKNMKRAAMSFEDDLSYAIFKRAGNGKGLFRMVLKFMGIMPRKLISRSLTLFIGKYNHPVGKRK